jgi:heptosyltransferase-2
MPIAIAIERNNPGAEITWITKPECKDLLEGFEFIDTIKTTPYKENKVFDILYNFDIEDEATLLANNIVAKRRYGFANKNGYPVALNLGAEYYLNTVFDDELKRRNRKTYQVMMFEAAEMRFKGEHAQLSLSEEEREYADDFIKLNGINTKRLIGIHMGASSRWPSKVWHNDKIKEFITKAVGKGYEILLFGGPNEVEKQRILVEELELKGIKVYQNNPSNTHKEFAALVEKCRVIVCSDSFALHISISMKKPTVALFFCTSPYEIENYNFLREVTSPLLEEFFPHKSDEYNEELVKSIGAEKVLEEVEEMIGKTNKKAV